MNVCFAAALALLFAAAVPLVPFAPSCCRVGEGRRAG